MEWINMNLERNTGSDIAFVWINILGNGLPQTQVWRNKIVHDEEWSMPRNSWFLISHQMQEYNSVCNKVGTSPNMQNTNIMQLNLTRKEHLKIFVQQDRWTYPRCRWRMDMQFLKIYWSLQCLNSGGLGSFGRLKIGS